MRAQQYDTVPTPRLDSPDELTDIRSLATELLSFTVNPVQVQRPPRTLAATAGHQGYGTPTSPWTAPGVLWDFSRADLAMNILCPDPALRGLWDWRSPFYLQVKQDPAAPLVQPQVIDFLKTTAWVRFIIEYHKDVPFVGILPAAIPTLPAFNARFVRPRAGREGAERRSGAGRAAEAPRSSGHRLRGRAIRGRRRRRNGKGAALQ